MINNSKQIPYKVKFDIKVSKSIISRTKLIPAIYKTKAFHICDYESNQEVHTNQFLVTLKDLKEVKKINKNLDYTLGYSNFSFDLWMILHKKQQINSISHRKQYVKGINSAYKENFKFIDDYKEEKNFRRILSKISLEDVIRAIHNGNEIRKRNQRSFEDKCKKFGNFEYYTENPDMTIHECVEQILQECGAIK